MDLMVFILLVVIIAIVFKDTRSLIYFIGISDVFMKLVHFIKIKVNVSEFTALVDKYIPVSVMGIINHYSEGFLNTILAWFYIIIMIWFLGYLLRYLIKRGR